MPTLSVRGTAFALWTRSSSLSMRTRTSMRRSLLVEAEKPLFLRGERRAGLPLREHLREAARDRLRDELVDRAAERRDLLDAARRDEAELGVRHQVDGLDVGSERAVQVVHLELPLEVGDHAQALDHRLRAPALRELDDELGEDIDLDVVLVAQGLLEEADPLVDGEHRPLVARLANDSDDDAVEDLRRPADDVEVAERDRVVAARADRGAEVVRRHSGSKRVTRTEP